jgi:hypothetical protein
MVSALADRYAGRPLVRLLDAYVLDVLGALDEQTAVLAQSMAPKVADALGVSGETWQEVIEKAMGIPPEARNELKAKWEEQVHEVVDQGGTPDVLGFTYALVDLTFGIEPVGGRSA